jgi:amidase
MSELWSLGAAEIARQVRDGDVGPEDVVQAHLARIAERDGTINAFQIVRDEKAMEEAHALSRRSDLTRLPLAGVPVAIKDNVDVAGEPTRHGSNATPDQPAKRDDELVARLRKAGAIVIGKTRLPELAIWPWTESAAFGETRNPWNPERTPGGSTGGGAAAVAAGMAPITLGSDGGGSIRIPSACCGIAGLRPGPGVIPLPGGATEHWFGMSEFGPMARSVEDVALMFDVLAGTEPRGTPSLPKPLRIALSLRPAIAGARVDPEVKTAVCGIADKLAQAGYQVERSDPPYPFDIGVRFARRWLTGIAEDAERLNFDALEPRTQSMVKAGRWITRKGWQRAAADDPFGARVREWMSNFDVLLMPTLSRPAVPVGHWRKSHWLVALLGAGNWVMTAPWNLARLPAASVPAGMSSDGLPIGLQLVAPNGGERTLLALMAQIQQLQPWLPIAP